MTSAGSPLAGSPVTCSGQPWLRSLTGPWAAGVVLTGFWIFMLASLWNKGPTYDEPGCMTAGYTYWRFNDYRLDPENGNLPQRVMALPLVTDRYRFPSLDGDVWRTSEVWVLGYKWFFQMGNDVAGMLVRGRAASGLLAVILGVLVWFWSRRLFGPPAGMLSLLLFVLSPTMLANGALTTSDTAVSLFFFASVGSVWAMLHRLTIGRVLLSALVMGGLFVSKMSAPMIGPMALVLVIARLLMNRPLPAAAGSWRGEIVRRRWQALAFVGAGGVNLLVVVVVIWGFYGFRYAAMTQVQDGRDRLPVRWELLLDKPDPLVLLDELGLRADQQAVVREISQPLLYQVGQWTPEHLEALEVIRRKVLTPAQNRALDEKMAAPPPTRSARLMDFLRRHHALPEAYLFGQCYVLKFRGLRNAFLNGKVSVNGWYSFFPYAFLVKTPLPVFAVIVLALAAAVARWRESETAPAGPPSQRVGPAFYETLPLWTLLAFYWALAVLGRLNIGHRHIMPTYAPLFVLCGAAADWLPGWLTFGRAAAPAVRARAGRAAGLILCSLIVLLAAEVLWRFPNYLAYFNAIAGGPAHAYRHLVDSSLDWGQDLPGVSRYLEQHKPTGPVYLAYFGVGSPNYYLPPAGTVHYLYSHPGHDVAPPLLTMELPPDKAEATLADALRVERDHEVVSRVREDDNQVQVVLLKKPAALRLGGGTYFISASMLQPVAYTLTGPLGPWNERYESVYQELSNRVKPLLSDDPEVRAAALRQHALSDWQLTLTYFEMCRFARLTAYLRKREPDDNINYSILVYKLTDADLAHALDGPPPELGRDLTRDLLGEANEARF